MVRVLILSVCARVCVSAVCVVCVCVCNRNYFLENKKKAQQWSECEVSYCVFCCTCNKKVDRYITTNNLKCN